MLYVYDFGDNRRHNVELERILPASGVVRPICLAGERHCPPEDVGGVPGYEDFLEVIFEPATKNMNNTYSGPEGRRLSTLGGTLPAGGVQHNGGERRPLADAMAKRLETE